MIGDLDRFPINLGTVGVTSYSGMTELELLNQYFIKINELIKQSNNTDKLSNDTKEYVDRVNQLTKDFMEWCKSNGIPEESMKIINAMYEDGRLEQLLNTQTLERIKNELTIKINDGDDIITNEVKTLKDDTDKKYGEVSSQLDHYANNKKNPTNLLSTVLQKLSKGEKLTIVCQGDSMTYGQDTVSSDKRPKDTSICDNGTSHSHERAGVVYPEQLKLYLDEIYPGIGHTVINKGYSGDWVEQGYNRWNINSNADIALLMYGSNDADLNASWVPGNVRGNLEKYINDYRLLIERYLKWGTAVVLLTPTRSLNQENNKSGRIAESFRNALFLLGREFNIPVIDSESFSNGWDSTSYSDSTHFNSKGYRAFSGRLISTLIGNILVTDYKLYSNENIGVRITRDNLVLGNGSNVGEAESSYAQCEITPGKQLVLNPNSGKCYYSFETVEDNMIVIPVYGCYGKSLKFTLDFNNSQGSSTFKFDGIYAKNINTQSSFITNKNENIAAINDLTKIVRQCFQTNKFFHITNKGIHNICIEQTEIDEQGAAFNGFIVLSLSDFKSYLRNNFLQKLTHQAWASELPDVSQIKIYPHELVEHFGEPNLLDVNYYRYIPLKVILLNANDSIVEHGFIWNDDGINGKGDTSAYKEGFYKKETVFAGSGTPRRNISSVNYNANERCYEVNFTGNLKLMGNITVSLI